MVDSEQVLGCKAPMGLVLVLLLSSLLGPLGQAQAQDCEKPMRYTMSLTGEHIQKEHFPNGLVVTFECATGYRSTGGSGKTTCAAGTWTTSTLSCEKFNCGSLELVNGHVEYSEGTSFGSVATFSCKDGYILSGREKLTCGNTEWLGRTPTCSVVKCDSPPSVDKAEGPSPKRDLYDFASVVRYKCQKDYTINGSASLKCSSNGKFTPNPPTCLMVRCKAPYIPNGSQKSGARPPYVHRSLVEYECNPGFKMEGEGVMTCQLNSTWSSTPECKEFNCGSLELVNGHVEYSEGTSFGSLATFSCNDGYILSGRNRLLCGNTEWLGRTPNCIGAVFTKDLSAKSRRVRSTPSVVKCDSPPSVDKAEGPSPKRDFYDFESVVRYNCQKDYTINGSASLKCKSNGEFTPNPPTCLMVRCKAPFIPNGSQKSGARPPYIHRSLVEYECKPGFKMEGEGVMTCQLDSTWSSTPECKVLPVDPTSSPVLPVDPTSSPVLPVDPTSSPVLPVDPTSSPVLPVDPTSSPVLPVDPTSSPVLPVDPTSSPVLPVDPTSSPGDSKTSSQFLWFLVLVPIVLAVAIGLTLKKRGSQSLRAPVPLEEDKIL
ncbi:C4b-binding protein alpha chain isoform X17 [Gadus morhua]|uniref:C4b-binding protein alpha chain isoform X17 n=1 Tax=Gadus morhua TaxID=8049 RepID=UPI0011B3D4D8|nr:C4b-binding protein alpha chain-like isoform X17 [Gadus morhua]